MNEVFIGQGFEDVFFLVGDWNFENDAFTLIRGVRSYWEGAGDGAAGYFGKFEKFFLLLLGGGKGREVASMNHLGITDFSYQIFQG